MTGAFIILWLRKPRHREIKSLACFYAHMNNYSDRVNDSKYILNFDRFYQIVLVRHVQFIFSSALYKSACFLLIFQKARESARIG